MWNLTCESCRYQARMQQFYIGPANPFTSPYLPSPTSLPLSSFFFPSFPFAFFPPSLRLPSPQPSLPLEGGPLNTAWGLGSAVNSRAGSGAKPQRTLNFVHFSLKNLTSGGTKFTAFSWFILSWYDMSIKILVCYKSLVQWREFYPISVTGVFELVCAD